MKPSLVITGSAGFLGTHTRNALRDSYSLISIDIRPTLPVASDELVITCDLGDEPALVTMWPKLVERRPVGLVHFAAFYDFRNRPDVRYRRLQHGLEWIVPRFHRDFPTEAVFVFSSSMAALAPSAPGVKLTPQSTRLGGWEYPRSKLAAEQALSKGAEPNCRHRFVELVLAGVYSDWAELVPLYQAIERMRSRSPEKYFLPASPDRGLTYVHVEDAVAAVERALRKAPVGHHRYLVGERTAVTNREIHQFSSLAFHNRPLPLWQIPTWFARSGAYGLGALSKLTGTRRFVQPWMIAFAGEHFEFDLSETEKDLGWEPRHDLRKELPALLRHAKDHAAEWQARNRARPW